MTDALPRVRDKHYTYHSCLAERQSRGTLPQIHVRRAVRYTLAGRHVDWDRRALCGIRPGRMMMRDTMVVSCRRCKSLMDQLIAAERSGIPVMGAWESRQSGRLHWTAHCSGGGKGPDRMRFRLIDEAEFTERAAERCRCLSEFYPFKLPL